MKWNVLIPAALAVCSLMAMAELAQAADAPAAYKEHCASCHGEARLGGIGPALIPENLARLRKAEAEKVIRVGRPATQMPAFGDKLNAEEIKAMIEYAYAPIKPMPAWGEKEITASRIVLEPKPLPDKPVFKADPKNLFVVVEPATTTCRFSTATNWSRFIASSRGSRCMAPPMCSRAPPNISLK